MFGLGFGEELDEVILPDVGLSVGAVAAGFGGRGDVDELAARDSLDLLLADTEVGRIDEVVGGVDEHDGDFDLVEFGFGVVVARGLEVVDEVVGVDVWVDTIEIVVDILLGRDAGGAGFLRE